MLKYPAIILHVNTHALISVQTLHTYIWYSLYILICMYAESIYVYIYMYIYR